MSYANHSVDRGDYQRIVDKLSTSDGFMARLLAIAFRGDVSAARIAREFGCTEDAALRLAMMRTPAVEREKFRDDLARIAGDVGIDVATLTAMVRQAQALSAFDAQAPANLLMAAHDHHDSDEDH